MKAIVLSGGGSKGAYQIGVWKALRELHVKYDIVTGTSVGALNGAFMVQKDYKKAKKIWDTISMDKIFGKEINTKNNVELYKVYAKEFIESNGIDPKGLEEIIASCLDKKKFYKSNIDFGLITLNVSNKKPLLLKKKDIPEDKLEDYLIASASCYPAFKPKEINDKKFIDGGYYDNTPINLAIELGATEAIVVDLNAPGITKKTNKNIPITRIKPNNTLANFLEFDKDLAKADMKYGYNDTMKVFKKYEGRKYTFTKNTITKLKNKYQDTFVHIFREVISSKAALQAINKILNIDDIEENLDKIIDKVILRSMEHLGSKYHLDDTRIYTLKSFNKLLISNFKHTIKDEASDSKDAEIYHLLKKQEYKKVKPIALQNPLTFLSILYIYTVLED